jgi:hypothetical protein
LQQDQRDYGGHRVTALNDLQAARTQIIAAEQYAVQVNHEDPACFQTHGSNGAADVSGVRGQGGSNGNIWHVTHWVDGMIGQLQKDGNDYGGHRVAAINSMQTARTELTAAEQYAKSHGY